MEILGINNDNVFLLFHASQQAEVGEQFKIIEESENPKGIIVQVISNDSHEYPGIGQELVQKILEEQISETHRTLDREMGLREIQNLKVAKAKIRKKIENGEWSTWDGWIPTRNVTITQVTPDELCDNILPEAQHALSFLCYSRKEIKLNGPNLDKVNVITGVKGSGKSHLAKHLVISLSSMRIPCIIFDINGEYSMLPNSINLRWGETFLPDLAELGYWFLLEFIQTLYPLPDTSRMEFEQRLVNFYRIRRELCEQQRRPFSIDVDLLLQQTWSSNQRVQGAIVRRLRVIQGLNLFYRENQQHQGMYTRFDQIFEAVCDNRPLVIDLKERSIQVQKALVNSILKQLEKICENEGSEDGQGRFPFVFFEEAHFYIEASDILNLITRGRHIGIASVFVTNTPERLPDIVFRQLDNLFLQALTHKDDIRSVSKNSFTDEETIEAFATRMLPRHALVIGKVTNCYPIICKVNPLPEGVPPTGVTRSTWNRFQTEQ